MSLVTEIKSRIVSSMKAKDEFHKNLFRVVLGDVQTMAKGAPLTDDMVIAVVKKQAASLKETITLGAGIGRNMDKEQHELVTLSALLPTNWDHHEIEAFFLNSDNTEFEQIQDAKNEHQAMGVAMKALKQVKAPVAADDVRKVIEKIRSS